MTAATHHSQIGELYAGHHSWLLGWLYRRLECRHQAADLAQDTFVRLLGRNELKGLHEPRAFLAAVARGLMIDHFRRQTLERAWLDSLSQQPEAEAPSAEERAIVLETLMEIDRLLEGLRPAVRSAFLLSQLDGLTYPQIAERLGVSLSSVQQYMTQAFSHCYQALYT